MNQPSESATSKHAEQNSSRHRMDDAHLPPASPQERSRHDGSTSRPNNRRLQRIFFKSRVYTKERLIIVDVHTTPVISTGTKMSQITKRSNTGTRTTAGFHRYILTTSSIIRNTLPSFNAVLKPMAYLVKVTLVLLYALMRIFRISRSVPSVSIFMKYTILYDCRRPNWFFKILLEVLTVNVYLLAHRLHSYA